MKRISFLDGTSVNEYDEFMLSNVEWGGGAVRGSVIENMIEIKGALPKKQRLLCNYIALNYDKVAMMTVAELAAEAEVGTTTVMRLMQLLKYESFSHFKRDLLNAAILRSNASYTNMRNSFSQQTATADTALATVCQELSYVVQNMLTNQNIQQFEAMVQRLLDADHIFVLGFRSSYAVARYFEDSAHLFLRKVKQLSVEQEFLYDNLLHMTGRDVLLVVSDWPCTKKTVSFAELCHKQGVPIALVTNATINPIARFADNMIDTNSVGEKAGRLPSVIVIEALVQELGRRTSPQSIEVLDQLEKMLKDNDIVMWEQGY